ncbi:MAG: hypothetical protein BAJALOKI1v1_740009 [Promethearchaeota archaeon]|nr:MAG: hypothetical protein BAJALOKI1v1_740009 [Candidatus Lokiarchaeota archaeon]
MRIWIDIEQPKTAVMFTSLIKKFEREGFELLITARDYGPTYQILDDANLSMEYYKVGRHGGADLADKLETHIYRLKGLLPLVKDFSPEFFVNFISVEGVRIAYGLQIPSIGYNDEPRNIPVCKLIFPLIDKIITPRCIPKEAYVQLYADPKKIIRYNGIDEIGWLSHFKPRQEVLNKYNLERGKYVIMRSEPSAACYFINKLKPNETLLSKIYPPLVKHFPNHKYLLIVRNPLQERFLKAKLKTYSDNNNLIITQYLPNLDDLCFYSSLVISGGGTIVRESSLLNVPSIEFFPGETAPQEHFLKNNGFPLEHIRNLDNIIRNSLKILEQGPSLERFTDSYIEKILQFEDPNEICYNYVALS